MVSAKVKKTYYFYQTYTNDTYTIFVILFINATFHVVSLSFTHLSQRAFITILRLSSTLSLTLFIAQVFAFSVSVAPYQQPSNSRRRDAPP